MGAILDRCSECGKISIEDSRLDLGDETLITLRCGHIQFTHKLVNDNGNLQGTHLNTGQTKAKNSIHFQDDSVEFIFNSGGRSLIGHEQGTRQNRYCT